jgi:ABC-2 type transport system ATP-binding protein
LGHAVEARQLEKRFTRKRSVRELLLHPFRKAEIVEALQGVDLSIREGEIFGLLGPNGAGKTTLLKILSCLVLPDAGTATVGGHPTSREQTVKPLIGLVHSDERSFYWRLTGRQNMNFFSTLYEVPGQDRNARIEELLRKVDMEEAADRRFADYSSGMKQRMAIARAMLHDPPILLMDEPTRSLDPAAALSLRRFIQDELSGRHGKTIVLATHNLHEAEVLCSRIAILLKGKVRQVGTVEEVRRWGLDTRNYEMEVDRWPAAATQRFTVLSDRPREDGRRVRVALTGEDGLNPMLAFLMEQGVTLWNCTQVDADLEGAFARILEAE